MQALTDPSNPASYPLANIISGQAARASAQCPGPTQCPCIQRSCPPTCHAGAVAATRADDELAIFSNFGATTVHLGAPGVNILSTWHTADSSYNLRSGTSMATPIVAGAAALLFAAQPNATYAQVRCARGGMQRPGARACRGWVVSDSAEQLHVCVLQERAA